MSVTLPSFRILVPALATVLMGGCAGPLVVYEIQSRGTELKLGYSRQGTGEQGLIECQVPQSGDIHSCRHMQIEFVE